MADQEIDEGIDVTELNTCFKCDVIFNEKNPVADVTDSGHKYCQVCCENFYLQSDPEEESGISDVELDY